MGALQAGDLGAFDVLYERYHRPVFGFLLRSLGDRRTAEDLLQETFLRVFQSRQGYRPLASFRAWLYTIARHLVVDYIRSRGNEPNENALGELVDPQASPVQQVVAQDVGERLWQAAMRLPRGQREALLLSRIGGLRHEEVARVTGASPAAVRVALHRALRSLREGLGRP